MVASSELRRFFRTPKGLLIIVLMALVCAAAPTEGLRSIAPGLLSAIVSASLFDVLILRKMRNTWEFPSGAVLTGLLVAMILTPQEPWYVVACISVIGVASKYIARTRSANIFNPAALALVVTFYFFDTGQSWWGALPRLSPFALIILFAVGILIADKVNKIPLVLMFLGTYFLLFTIAAYLGNSVKVAEIFRAPDLHAALFFAFFILTDPPTSPVRYDEQLICGVIVAVASFAIFESLGAAFYLLGGVLVGNIWEGWHRSQSYSRRQSSHLNASVRT